MKGAETLVRLARELEMTVCFANPGTTELDFVAAFDAVDGVHPVLGLHEDVCTGAADGWARITGRVGLTLLHLGAGLGNGLANLQNARRAGTPIVNVVGDHPSWHLPHDPPLASDLVGLASAGTLRAYVSSDYDRLDDAFLFAWSAAVRDRGPMTLVVRADDAGRQLPGDSSCRGNSYYAFPARLPCHLPISPTELLDVMRRAERPAMVIGGSALRPSGLAAAARIEQHFSAAVFTETYPAVLHTGRGVPSYPRVPASAPEARLALSQHDVLVMLGASDPVAFFGSAPGLSRLRPDSVPCVVGASPQDAATFLEAVADLLPKPRKPRPCRSPRLASAAGAPLTAESVAMVLIAMQAEDSIVIDEANTLGSPYRVLSSEAPPHLQIGSTAGALGFGMPAAIGAALADRNRRVITLQADGSAAYCVQALWTQAREGLNITTVLLNNRGYETVRSSWRSANGAVVDSASLLFEIQKPHVDWVAVARGFGVSAVSVKRTDALRSELRLALNTAGPRVIVVQM